MKYYKSKRSSRRHIEYIRELDSQPEAFKGSKLMYVHKILIERLRGGHYEVQNVSYLTDKETFELNAKYAWVETTEEEFNETWKKVEYLEREFDKILE